MAKELQKRLDLSLAVKDAQDMYTLSRRGGWVQVFPTKIRE